MLDKFVTRLHEINENPKTRLALDLLFVFILALALIFCILGVQGCFETRTVYAADEDTLTITFGDLPSVEVPTRFSDYCIAYQNGSMIDAYFVDLTADNFTFSVCYDASNHYKVVLYTDSASDRLLYRYRNGVWEKLGDAVHVDVPSSIGISLISNSSAVNVLYSSSDILEPDKTTVGYSSNFDFPSPPLPPFSITTLGDYCLSISGGLFGVAKDAIDFIMEHPIALLGVVLFLFVSGSGIVKNLAKGV